MWLVGANHFFEFAETLVVVLRKRWQGQLSALQCGLLVLNFLWWSSVWQFGAFGDAVFVVLLHTAGNVFVYVYYALVTVFGTAAAAGEEDLHRAGRAGGASGWWRRKTESLLVLGAYHG